MLPGVDITHTHQDVMQQIRFHRNPKNIHPLLAISISKQVDKDFLQSEFFAAGPFFVYYERPDCPKKDRLAEVEAKDLVVFLQTRIRPERGEGITLTITTAAMEEFLLCNHDGGMFYRKPNEWPNLDHLDV